jgi:hypothetical protein
MVMEMHKRKVSIGDIVLVGKTGAGTSGVQQWPAIVVEVCEPEDPESALRVVVFSRSNFGTESARYSLEPASEAWCHRPDPTSG